MQNALTPEQLSEFAAFQGLTANRFAQLAQRWRENTVNLSSTNAIVLDDCYQQIIGLGPVAIALILNELRKAPEMWFPALRALTGANPITDEIRGDMKAMQAAWLRWGKEHGYLEP